MSGKENKSVYQLVLLPGLDGTGELFSPFIETFPDRDRISVISYPTDYHIPFEQLEDYIIARLPNDRPMIILGESYSGPVALKLAARNDLNILAVILVATFARFPLTPIKFVSRLLPLSLLLRLPIPAFIIRYFCFGAKTTQALSQQLRNSVRSNKPGILARRARDGATVNVTSLLGNINKPCLYIRASKDKLVPVQAMYELQGYLPDLVTMTIDGPHFILQTEPQKCRKTIQGFLHKNTL